MRPRRSRVGRWPWIVAVAGLVACLTLPTAVAVPRPSGARPAGTGALVPGAWFDFSYDIYLDEGTGNYSGYTDQTLENYAYTIVSVAGDNVTVHGHGTWTYSNNTGGSLNGGWTETFSFSLASRLYLWGFDVNGSYTNPSVWFWVPTGLALGQTVRILDSNYTVQSLGSDNWAGFPPIPRLGVELQASGSDIRDDDYGVFDSSWDDTYWFDPATGFLIGEYYVEMDHDSMGDGFRWREIAAVTSSSYPIALDWVILLSVYAGLPAILIGSIVTVRWYHRGPRRVASGPGAASPRVVVRRVRNPAHYAALPPASSSPYGPFLPILVRRAARARNPVWVASDGQHLVGAMVRDREAKLAILFTQDPALARLFRSMHRAKNFFAEVPDGAWDPHAKVVDSFHVLELNPVLPRADDTSTVRPMTPEDLPAVIQLARTVYDLPGAKWLEQAFREGDLGFVARLDGALTGFAFATTTDDAAVLHTLTVRPDFRGQGVGKSLMAARLNALTALGIGRALVEISERNPPSMAIARRFGFRPIARTTYYSRRLRTAGRVDRRPL